MCFGLKVLALDIPWNLSKRGPCGSAVVTEARRGHENRHPMYQAQ